MAADGTRYSGMTVADAVKNARADLPAGCPLTVHTTGQWAKKIRGRRVYFGSVREVSREAAEAEYYRHMGAVADDRPPESVTRGGLTVADVFERFYARQMRRAEAGEIALESLAPTAERLAQSKAVLGPETPVSALRPQAFEDARTKLAARYSAGSVKRAIGVSRSAFLWAFETAEIIPSLPRYGTAWRGVGRKRERLEARRRGFAGVEAFTADQVNALLEANTDPMLRAAMLLGINGGFLAKEIADLEPWHVDLEAGWVDMAREKTGADRRVPLWPLTVEAIRAAMPADDHPRKPDAEGRLFVARSGRPLVYKVVGPGRDGHVRGTGHDAIRTAFQKLLVASKVRPDSKVARGVGFKYLRSTFATVADELGDEKGKRLVMGHTIDSAVADSYVKRIGDDRLQRVAGHVHAWLGWGDVPGW